jgi:tRNA_anti-like
LAQTEFLKRGSVMGMTKCKECGTDISTKADACPKCGAKQVQTSGCAKVVLAVVIFLVFALIVGQCSRNSSTTGAQDSSASSSAAEQEVVAVSQYTAADIASAYEANTVAADQQFKGRKFQVTGTVVDINTDLFGNPYVTLRGGANQFMEPQFQFSKSQQDELAQLKKGDQVSLICTGKGDIAKTPMSDSCSLQ